VSCISVSDGLTEVGSAPGGRSASCTTRPASENSGVPPGAPPASGDFGRVSTAVSPPPPPLVFSAASSCSQNKAMHHELTLKLTNYIKGDWPAQDVVKT